MRPLGRELLADEAPAPEQEAFIIDSVSPENFSPPEDIALGRGSLFFAFPSPPFSIHHLLNNMLTPNFFLLLQAIVVTMAGEITAVVGVAGATTTMTTTTIIAVIMMMTIYALLLLLELLFPLNLPVVGLTFLLFDQLPFFALC